MKKHNFYPYSLIPMIVFGLILGLSVLFPPWSLPGRADEAEPLPAAEEDSEAGMPNRSMRGGYLRLLQQLREDNPEQYEELMQLRRQQPDQFRSALREYLHEQRRSRNDKFAPHDQEITVLAERYHQAESEADRETLKKQLKEQLNIAFDERIERYKRHLEAMAERLERMRGELLRQQEKRDQLLKEQLDFLTHEAKE